MLQLSRGLLVLLGHVVQARELDSEDQSQDGKEGEPGPDASRKRKDITGAAPGELVSTAGNRAEEGRMQVMLAWPPESGQQTAAASVCTCEHGLHGKVVSCCLLSLLVQACVLFNRNLSCCPGATGARV